MIKKLNKQSDWSWVHELVSIPGVAIKFPYFFHLIAYYEPDRFPPLKLENEKDVINFIAWWELSASVNFPWVVWPEKMEDFPAVLWDPDPDVVQDGPLIMTKALVATWRIHHWFHTCDLNTREGRRKFIFWWIENGQYDCRILRLSLKQREYFFNSTESIIQDRTLPIFKELFEFWYRDSNLQHHFPLNTKESRQQFMGWALEHWKTSHPLSNPSLAKKDSFEPVTRVYAPEQFSLGTYEENGINIAGFAKGVMGIGEDTRMAALSADSANIPFSVYNLPIDLAITSNAHEADEHIHPEPVYATNLICLPVMDIFYIYLKKGDGLFHNRYNIGAWQWELPLWPEKFKPFFNTMNEIWAFSHHAEKTFLEASNIPVIYMPMAVEIPNIIKVDRKEFNLPENKFLFLVMFDANSWIKRKNPLAAIEAFKRAFPNQQDVGLVIKTMNVKENDSDWDAIKNSIASDTRIIVINETLSRTKTISLIDCCDCYVSLHRAEGFGRIIAESMLLGKPVIVTNYSGNTDYTTPETAFMVNGPMIALNPGDYSVWENQYWCDPDIDEAAPQMQLCFENKSLREKIAAQGQAYIKKHHSAKAVGEKYKKRLLEIGAIRETSNANIL